MPFKTALSYYSMGLFFFYSNRHWYRQPVALSNNSGCQWTFYENTTGNPASIRFAYNVTGKDEGSVTVSVINSVSQDIGSFLTWTSSGTEKTFEAYGAKKNEKYLISWNELTEAGSIENEITKEKYCWDNKTNKHRNIVCQ
jgi:hypothetical protein